MMLFAATLAMHTAATQVVKCGDACNNGITICDPTAECNLCVPHPAGQNKSYACLAGCSNPCTADAHCGSAGCGTCTKGACAASGPGPGHQTCGGVCDDGKNNCNPKGTCNLCIPTAKKGVFACGAGCGNACTEDSQCMSAGCGKCAGGACVAAPAPPGPPVPPQACAGPCNDGVHQCGATDECALCIPHPAGQNKSFACLAGCNRTCATDEHCGSAGCGKCKNSRCAPSGPAPGPVMKCNGKCTVNTDCDQTGECNICVPKTSTSFQCSVPCGKKCSDDSHCGVANCMHCTNGTCGRV